MVFLKFIQSLNELTEKYQNCLNFYNYKENDDAKNIYL